MPVPWVRQGEVHIPGVTCAPSSLPPCTQDNKEDNIPGVSCQDKPKTMAQIVADVLTQAIMRYIEENQILQMENLSFFKSFLFSS